VFCALNGHDLRVQPDDAVEMMLAIAAGDLDESAAAVWLRDRIEPGET
jgi:prophage maintenance system killer protein